MTNTQAPTIIHVELIHDDEIGWRVSPVWSGVDRPNVGGWAVANKNTAERLRRALLAGAAYSKIEVCTDVDGKTYVHGTSLILARKASADLRRLGF